MKRLVVTVGITLNFGLCLPLCSRAAAPEDPGAARPFSVFAPSEEKPAHRAKASEEVGTSQTTRPGKATKLASSKLTRRSASEANAPADRGLMLFMHEWQPHDPLSPAGDGLGPVFNEQSCVACHKQSGPGGSGPLEKNVVMISAPKGPKPTEQIIKELTELHPAFRDADSVVLHRHGTDRVYESWREVMEESVPGLAIRKLQQRVQQVGVKGVRPEFLAPLVRPATSPRPRTVTLLSAERNTPPLFGTGLIDQISDETIIHGAGEHFAKFPAVKGRPSILPGGKVGKFGWKAQVASLNDFVLSACAGELGLEVPGHHQAIDPLNPDAVPPGLDMSVADAEQLVSYIRALPAPVEIKSRSQLIAKMVEQGARLFDEIGCATCHRPSLGDVNGIYSDLLLHDMGLRLSDASQYYGVPPQSPGASSLATSSEWRTPPLWGLKDAGPFLHNGRAKTLTVAISMHDGEARESSLVYKSLSKSDRQALHYFLSSLAAPPQTGHRAIGTSSRREMPKDEKPKVFGNSPRRLSVE